MAGASIGDGDDNPVAINVTPLIDVIFCLCVFFMCSFRFKQLEGKFDTWLPKNKGAEGMPVGSVIEEVRVALFWNEAKQQVERKIGRRIVPEDSELQQLIADSFADYKKLGKDDIGLTIDADTAVPWDAVVRVINLSKRVGVQKIEFALGAKEK
ncbi:MAG: biopolymer transporter ExbD [Planctomycetes bacterium]|nr:biopolymer transporter ExbD [Planctomycetota bacterium]